MGIQFPWDLYVNPIPVGFPSPMHTSNRNCYYRLQHTWLTGGGWSGRFPFIIADEAQLLVAVLVIPLVVQTRHHQQACLVASVVIGFATPPACVLQFVGGDCFAIPPFVLPHKPRIRCVVNALTCGPDSVITSRIAVTPVIIYKQSTHTLLLRPPGKER